MRVLHSRIGFVCLCADTRAGHLGCAAHLVGAVIEGHIVILGTRLRDIVHVIARGAIDSLLGHPVLLLLLLRRLLVRLDHLVEVVELARDLVVATGLGRGWLVLR